MNKHIERDIILIQDTVEYILGYWGDNSNYLPEDIKKIYCNLKQISYECTKFKCIDKEKYLIQKINVIQDLIRDTLDCWNKSKSCVPKEMVNMNFDILALGEICELLKKQLREGRKNRGILHLCYLPNLNNWQNKK